MRDIRNPFRNFTERENTLLGARGLAYVEQLKEARRNNGGGGGRGRGRGRGRGGYGRGGRGYRYNYNRDRSNNTNNNDGGANANTGGGNRNVNESNTGGRAGQNEQPQQSSNSSACSITQSQASTSGDRGGQNGSRFGNNRPYIPCPPLHSMSSTNVINRYLCCLSFQTNHRVPRIVRINAVLSGSRSQMERSVKCTD
jgi:hypothetical protein